MVKKAQLITNVMDRLTQAVAIGVWLLHKVVLSYHQKNKENHTTPHHNTRKKQTTSNKMWKIRRMAEKAREDRKGERRADYENCDVRS